MATLEKIRSKSVLLLIIIGVALLAFIIGDFLTSSRTIFGTGTTVAKVDGQSIDIQAFQKAVEAASTQMQNQGQKIDQAVLQQQVLSQMVAETLLNEEIEKLGLTVTSKELTDAMVGAHSGYFNNMVMQMSQGQLSAQQFNDMVKNPGKYQIPAEQAGQYRAMWQQYEKDMTKQLVQNKFQVLFAGTLVANKLDAKALYDESANTEKMLYALKPYNTIPDAQVEVTDQDLQAEWQKTKERYAIPEETRDINFISVAIVPSAADITKAETRVSDLVAALNAKPGTEGLDGFDEFVCNRTTLPVTQLQDRAFRSFADSAAVGSAKIVNRAGNSFAIAKILSRESAVDSVNVNVLQVQGKRAQIDSVIMALNAGEKTADLQKKFPSVIGEGQDSAWVTLTNPSFATVKDRIISATAGQYFMADTIFNENQPTTVIRVNSRKNPVSVVELAAIDYTIDPSNATVNGLQHKLQEYINANATAKDFAANAVKSGYQSMPAMVSVSTPQLPGVSESRAAIYWAMKAKKGEVSPIMGDENNGAFFVAALNDVYEDYLPATQPQVKEQLTAEVRKDKKAEKLIAQYNGKAKDVAGYASAMGVKADTCNINFAALNGMYPDYASAKVLGLTYNAPKGKLFAPMQANNGVVVMQVLDVEKNGRPYDFKENATVFNRTRGGQALSQLLPLVLQGKNKVKNNLLEFYHE